MDKKRYGELEPWLTTRAVPDPRLLVWRMDEQGIERCLLLPDTSGGVVEGLMANNVAMAHKVFHAFISGWMTTGASRIGSDSTPRRTFLSSTRSLPAQELDFVLARGARIDRCGQHTLTERSPLTGLDPFGLGSMKPLSCGLPPSAGPDDYDVAFRHCGAPTAFRPGVPGHAGSRAT